MTFIKKYILLTLGILSLLSVSEAKADSFSHSYQGNVYVYHPVSRSDSDTNALPYPFIDKSGYMNPLYVPDGGLMLSNPSNIKTVVEYNTDNGQYDIFQRIGNEDYRPPTEMDSDQYDEYMWRQAEKKYFQQKVSAESQTQEQKKALIPPIKIGGKFFEDVFGGNTINITPQGSAELTFGFNNSKMLNPALPVAQQSLTTFNFDENIQLNVTGQIGTKLKLSTSYNTKATFDFQNQMKLQYQGKEDDIIKEIDAGNVTFNLPGTLITGSQSLFGAKIKLQFGKLTSTTVYAQEKGDKKTIVVQNGSQTTNFNIKADQYMVNQHYFLAQYFRDNYDSALEHLPLITEGVTITRVEVWVTNTTAATQNTRYILAFSDLGESKPHFTHQTGGPVTLNYNPARGYTYNSPSTLYLPSDSINSTDPYFLESRNSGVSNPSTAINSLLAEGYQQVTDYEKVDLARMLSSSEYTLNSQLGYISLKQPLLYNQVLAVAYQYTKNGHVYQVGQFSTDGVPTGNEMVVKMLKSSNVTPGQPIWSLMMKNIYSLGSYQINQKNFMLNVWYSNAATGYSIPYLPEGKLEGKQLIGVLGLDQLDQEGDRVPDGLFDFVNGITIDATNGYVIFPSVEPFGYYLRMKMMQSGDPAALAANYVFQPLYDSLLIAAQQIPTLDRFWIKGSFQSSSSSDINLGAANIPQGSVIVTAGGQKLTENVDYTVDYTLGRLKIINQGLLSSGTPIQISLENNALFSIESKTFFGQHFDYMVSKDFNLGATVVNYTEHPLTQIVSIGQEPVSNTMIGLNGDFKKPAPFLTDLIDDLPMIHTKAPSEITASSEVAAMIPGHPKFIGSNGTAYIDDFEGTESFIDISPYTAWSLASIPGGQPSEFPEAAYNNDLRTGMNRAKIAWYTVDPLFQQNESGVTPPGETTVQMSDDRIRMVLQTEIFPDEQSPTGTPINLPVLNVGFYPQMRGAYNYDPPKGSNVSKGIADAHGDLNDPQSRWGGIMRPISETDFITNNIQYIEFWMMDPYTVTPTNTGPNNTGVLYFDLGSVSEDVLKDGQKSFENGLPTDQADSANPNNTNNPWVATAWGHVPVNPSLVDAFDNDETTRPFQDIGLDGLSDPQEQIFFKSFVNQVHNAYPNSHADSATNSDPSSDDYHYYRGDDYDEANLDVVDRYMMYNGLENNSPTQLQYGSQNPKGGSYPTDETTLPNTEDINQDNTLEQVEAYYEYAVQISPNAIKPTNIGSNYIISSETVPVQTQDNSTHQTTWLQFKIPIDDYVRRVGPIADFNSIQYVRMYFRGFDKPVLLRFAKLELVSDAWRKYAGTLLNPGDYVPNEAFTTFDEYGVNLEENSNTTPVNYVIPPGIQRQLNLQSANLVQENEGSLSLQVCNLQDGDARGVTKNTQLDLRAYKTLNMFVHAQSGEASQPLKDGDVTGFIRMGSDYTENYYEYEVPLAVTPAGNYNTNNNNDQLAVWPLSNTMDVALSTLENAKLARDAAMETNPNITLQTVYTVKDGINNVTVVGNPTLSSVQVMMLGVRNPKRTLQTATTDDGKPKCAEVWFDELRMTNFDEKGGWATVDRATAKLADLGTISLAGNVSTPGFGTLEANVGSLSRETDMGYSVATNLEMGKFFPQSWNVSVPTYMSYSDQWIIPEYNPLDPDILLDNALGTLNKRGQDSIKSMVISRTIARSLNFTNVHINRGKNAKKAHFYDITNLSASYAFTDQSSHDVNYILNYQKSYKGALTYNYSFHPKAIEPFKKMDFFRKRKYLAVVSDFNFYPMIDKVSVNGTLDREYSDFEIRNIIPGLGELQLPIAVNKVFNVDRTYSFTFPITKSLQLEYSANNASRVMEPEGLPITTAIQRDSVRESFFNHQVNTDFTQTASLNYTLPLKEIPWLDFMTVTARYSSSYQWVHAPFGYDSLGATISNSNTEQINGSFNMSTLYNKVPFIRDMLKDQEKSAQQQQRPLSQSKIPGKESQAQPPAPADNEDSIHDGLYYGEKYITYFLTSLKTLNFTYSDNRGTVLPGYTGVSTILGMQPGNNWTPGLPFVFGSQSGLVTMQQQQTSDRFITQIERDSMIAKLVNNYTPSSTANTQTYSVHASLTPLPDMKLDLTATRTMTKNASFYITDTLGSDGRYHTNENTYTESGSFSMSYLFVKTIFATGGFGNTNPNQPFINFLNNSYLISQRQAALNPHSTGQAPINPLAPNAPRYFNGYSIYSQDVAIPAFLAAYSGQSPNKVPLNPFPSIPLPNWTLSYNIYKPIASVWPWAKKNITSITLSNAYSGVYSIGSFTYNPLFQPDATGMPTSVDLNGDFIDKDQIPAVSLADQFSPLAKLVVAFKSGISSNFEIRNTRQVALDLTDIEITEVYATEYLLGLGYKIKGVLFPIKIGGKAIKNDVTLKADFSIMNNESIVRNAINQSNQITGGQQIISIKTQAEYNITTRITIRLFFDKVINNPFISSTFPTSTMDGGFAIRFSLS